MKIQVSSFCDSIGLYLNCTLEDGQVSELRITGKPRHEETENPVLARVCSHISGNEEDILDIPIRIRGTDFQSSVWQALREIPRGEVRTYSEIAIRVGRPGAVRAVGNAVGANRLTILVPCHRVVAKNGIGGFSSEGGVETKARLLDAESRDLHD